MDLGVADHDTFDDFQLTVATNYKGNDQFQVGNGESLSITYIRHVLVPSHFHSKVCILKMSCLSYITRNLFSISKITKDNYVVVEFCADKCVINDKHTQTILLQGQLKDDLYQLNISHFSTSLLHSKFNSASSKHKENLSLASVTCIANKTYMHQFRHNSSFAYASAKSSSDSSMLYTVPISKFLNCDNKTGQPVSFAIFETTIDLWHTKVGHPNSKILVQVLNSMNVVFYSNCDVSFCNACQLGKLKQISFVNPFLRPLSLLN